MDTPSNNSRSWDHLTRSARSAAVPAEVDVRASIRAGIRAPQPQFEATSLLDDVLDLFRSRWLQAGFAALALSAFLAFHDSLEAVNEMSWIWQLQGPVLAGI
ncbi:hypothetical protein HNQ65_003881 [Prosthecobacter vanneervenii]|uniref:Uncharacterized protein n=1 Tax=Prosthecobacter vanneervenii TaxID=48466 RepID=A0A7W7YE08_9BACT|nr:hypothetical protein [Prosthecobacter vanneervenii]